jgi:hypothetical protein
MFVRMPLSTERAARAVCVVTPCEISKNPFAVFYFSVKRKKKEKKERRESVPTTSVGAALPASRNVANFGGGSPFGPS